MYLLILLIITVVIFIKIFIKLTAVPYSFASLLIKFTTISLSLSPYNSNIHER